MITDTAPFRYPYYQKKEDTFDKIHYVQMAEVVISLTEAIYQISQQN